MEWLPQSLEGTECEAQSGFLAQKVVEATSIPA